MAIFKAEVIVCTEFIPPIRSEELKSQCESA